MLHGLYGLQLVRQELFLFAAFWFVVGAFDELAVDLAWFWLRLTGRARTGRLPQGFAQEELHGRAAVLVPAWCEAEVIGAMVRHTLAAWRQKGLVLYVGCYRNDPATLAAAIAAAGDDPRLRIVVHDAEGPTTKADCLNRLYEALCADEARGGVPFCSVILQDAEDMVHPAGLVLLDRALDRADFAQLPVRPEPQPGSRWIAGHYADEFAESHAKAMVVRDWLGAALPAAGVGCGFSRSALRALAIVREAEGGDRKRAGGPFAAECLTEDYELGLLIARMGGRGRFVRCRDDAGQLVATRSYFPESIETAVRQKTRWVHGIALQGWERLGWTGRPVDLWMALRDRRGPMTSLVLAAAYALLAIEAVFVLAGLAGYHAPPPGSPLLGGMLAICTFAFGWRMALRLVFTAREYGLAEGLRAVLRIPLANVIAIMSGRRALFAYVRSLGGMAVTWDKTEHCSHPAMAMPAPVRA